LTAWRAWRRTSRSPAASDKRLQLQLRLTAEQDRIAHFGEAIDDRAIIDATRRQQHHERVQRAHAAAAARARYAARMARLQANEARLQAQIKAGPKFHFGIDTDELHNDVIKDIYAQGIYVRVSDSVNIDGLKIERARGIYDTLYGRGNLDLDAEVQRYRELKKQDPSLVGLEIIAIEDMITPAEQARRLKLAEVQTFNQFSKAYAKTQRSSEGVEKAFLEYHFKRSKEINANWDRIDNAAGAVNLIAKGTMLGVGFVYDPVGTVGSLIVEFGTEKVLRAAGVDEQTAAMISGIAGVATGGAISYRQMANAQPSVQNLVRAERAARAEYDAVRLAARAAEFEASKGAQIAEGVTLFKGIPSQARAAKAAYISPLLDAPSRSTPLALAGDVPRSGGVPPIPGPDFSGAGPIPGEQHFFSGGPPLRPQWETGAFEWRSRLIANISDGSGGFTGGTIVATAPVPAPALPLVGQRLLPAGRIRGNVNSTPSLGPIPLGPIAGLNTGAYREVAGHHIHQSASFSASRAINNPNHRAAIAIEQGVPGFTEAQHALASAAQRNINRACRGNTINQPNVPVADQRSGGRNACSNSVDVIRKH
jgi:hypothetical protein